MKSAINDQILDKTVFHFGQMPLGKAQIYLFFFGESGVSLHCNDF